MNRIRNRSIKHHLIKVSSKINNHRYFLLFTFILSYLLVIYSRLDRNNNSFNIFSPDAPVAMFIGALMIFLLVKQTRKHLHVVKNRAPSNIQNNLTIFTISLLLYLAVMNAFSFFISFSYGYYVDNLSVHISRNFNSYTLLKVNLSRLIEFILFGTLYLSYTYAKEVASYRDKIDQYNSTLTLSKIQQLKAQLNPHFLFNNLNALDQLIEDDKDKASEFLNHFAELYRYSLSTSEQKLQPITEELQLIEHYFKLMQYKYTDSYFLEIKQKTTETELLVPPFCLQLLIENAIEHNLATSKSPVHIEILITDKIKVSNNKLPQQSRKNTKKTNGRALANLSEQFKLLTKQDIEILDTPSSFTVILPLITKMNEITKL
jgi:sensor histidine kinase YesM